MTPIDRPWRSPVVAPRREHVQDNGAVRPGVHLVRHVWRDPPGAAWAELPYLVTDTERDRSADYQAELLVRMAVLPDDAPRIELDDGQRAEIAVDRACDDAVPDTDRVHAGELVEHAHADNLVDALRDDGAR